MLDSNTDRSYFMIGAVIVGALIIGAAAWVFGELIFAQGDGLLTNLIKDTFEKATGALNNIGDIDVPGSGGGS